MDEHPEQVGGSMTVLYGVVGGLYIGTTGVACYKKMVFLSTNSPLP
eukprot:COSAG01_NODE_42676_length_437_cov_2.532544_1_plen_45_part_01